MRQDRSHPLALLLALTFAAVALAGCVTDAGPEVDDTTEMDEDAPADGGNGTPGAIDSGGSDNGDDQTSRPADGEEPNRNLTTTPDGDVSLHVLTPDSLSPGHESTWRLTATHEGGPGDDPFPYSSICHSPWGIELESHDSVSGSLHEPMAECAAYGTGYLEPGESKHLNWTWNLTHWTQAEGYQPIGGGDHTLTFWFERQDEETGRSRGPTATFDFTIA